jgi:hypothetical protein
MIKIKQTPIIENTPAWELEITDLPERLFFVDLFKNELVNKKPDRTFYNGDNEVVKKILTEFNYENLSPILNTVFDNNKEIVNTDVFNDNIEIKTYIVRDDPKYNLIPHYDNNFIFGVAMINLTDNKSSTILYTKDNKINYVSEKIKGKGVLYLNNIETKHGFYNEDNDFRYAIMVSINLNKI